MKHKQRLRIFLGLAIIVPLMLGVVFSLWQAESDRRWQAMSCATAQYGVSQVRVVDFDTGQPISGAKIRAPVSGDDCLEEEEIELFRAKFYVSDANGEFAFVHMGAFVSSIWIEAQGCEPIHVNYGWDYTDNWRTPAPTSTAISRDESGTVFRMKCG